MGIPTCELDPIIINNKDYQTPLQHTRTHTHTHSHNRKDAPTFLPFSGVVRCLNETVGDVAIATGSRLGMTGWRRRVVGADVVA